MAGSRQAKEPEETEMVGKVVGREGKGGIGTGTELAGR